MSLSLIYERHGDLFWAGLSGLLLALAFPRPDLTACAWVAFVPLFLVMDKRPFAAGFCAGAVFFAFTLYWLNIVMTTYGGMNPVFSFAAYLMMTAYLALFFGAAAWSAVCFRQVFNLPCWVSLPVLWVAAEYLRSWLFSGFPWANTGYSQHAWLVMIQSADLFGVYGLTFLIVLVNAVLAQGVRAVRSGSWRKADALAAGLALACFAANWGYGIQCLKASPDARENTLNVVAVQGNIDQSIKWKPAYQESTVERYEQLSERAVENHRADLIIWPESAMPFYFKKGEALADRVLAVPRRLNAQLLFGSPAYEIEDRRVRYLNSAFLLSRKGQVVGRSDKVHLVPFGEYNPLGSLAPFLKKMVAGIGDFSPGVIRPLPMEKGKAGVLVCFEAIFPEIARHYTRLGCDILVNITNDAWFGRSAAPYQHLAMTLFRAVENRVWVARAANTGISAFIAPSGRVVSQTRIFKTLSLSHEISLGSHRTLYNRMGDAVPALFLGASCLGLGAVRLSLKRQKKRA